MSKASTNTVKSFLRDVYRQPAEAVDVPPVDAATVDLLELHKQAVISLQALVDADCRDREEGAIRYVKGSPRDLLWRNARAVLAELDKLS